jgi:hypothetical protein
VARLRLKSRKMIRSTTSADMAVHAMLRQMKGHRGNVYSIL